MAEGSGGLQFYQATPRPEEALRGEGVSRHSRGVKRDKQTR